MKRLSSIGLLALAAHAAGAQQLAARIAATRDGTVRFTYAARSGVCGDGRDVIRIGDVTYVTDAEQTYRGASMNRCDFGAVRAEILRSAGQTDRIRLHVGGQWDALAGATDLGTVAAPEAARWFLAEARRSDRREAATALEGAIVADSVVISPELDAIARATDLPRGVRGAAIFALATVDEPDSRRLLRALVTDDKLDVDRRGEAIIALGGRNMERDDARFLRGAFASLDPRLHDKVFLAVSHTDDPDTQRWLLDRVLDASAPIEERRQALFWAGQGSMPTASIAALYPKLEDRALREHYTFVLSQRRDSAAVEELISVAQHDEDRTVRRRAMFWLGQSRNPRARSYLQEVLSR